MARLRWPVRAVAPPVPVAATEATLSGALVAANAVEGIQCGSGQVTGGNAVGIASMTPSNPDFYCIYSAENRNFTLHVSASGVGNLDPEDEVTTFSGTDTNGLSFGPTTERTVVVSAPGVLTTLSTATVVNDGSTVTNGMAFIGLAVRRGEIDPGAGEVPIITDDEDNDLSAQVYNISTRQEDDDSVLHFAAVVPVGAMDAAATMQFKLQKAEDTYTPVETRSLSDITDRDIEFVISDVRTHLGVDTYGSGEFIFRANDYAGNSSRVRKVATGHRMDAWKIDGHMKDTDDESAATHLWGQVFGYAVTDPANAANCLDVGVVARVCVSPWMNVSGATALCYRAALYADGGLVRDFATTKTFADGDVNTSTYRITIPAHGYKHRQLVKYNGTLTGPDDDGLYLVWYIDANTIMLFTIGTSYSGGAGPQAVAITAASGGGTHTLTTYFYQPARTMHTLCGEDARPDWLDDAVGNIRLQLTTAEKDYWMESGMFPPIDTSLTPSAHATTERYIPGSNSPLRAEISGTGDTGAIGCVPEWTAKWWIAQDSVSYRAMRVAALHALGIPGVGTLNEQEVSGEKIARIPVMINGSDGAGATFSGLGNNFPTTHYFSSGNKANTVAPDGHGGVWYEQTGPDTSHGPQSCWDIYLFEGLPHWLDGFRQLANRPLFSYTTADGELNRQHTIGGTTYRGKLIRYSQVRSSSYAFSWLSLGAALGDDADPEKAYFSRCVFGECLPYIQAYIASRGGVWEDWGLYGTYPSAAGTSEACWQTMLNLMTASWSWKMHGTAGNAAHANHIAKLAINLLTNTDFSSPYYAPQYYARTTTGYNSSTLISSFADWPTTPPEVSVIFATDGTVTMPSNQGTWAEGDRVRKETANPPELGATTWYYLRDYNAGTRQGKLYAASSGGSPITYASGVTANCSGIQYTGGATFHRGYDTSSIGYGAMLRAAVNMYKWAGGDEAGIDDALTEVNTRFTGSFVSNPKFSMKWPQE